MTIVLMVANCRGATNGPWRPEAGRTPANGIALASAVALAACAQLPRAPR
jgi:hypothetical protein